MTQRFVILDRDGVINVDSDDYIKSPDEWLPLDGSLQAIADLYQHGYKIVVITNQSGVARGLFTLETLYAMHDKMQKLVTDAGGRIEAIYFCPHDPSAHCDCRKPETGLYTRFADEHQVKLDAIYAVGDSYRDLQAARSCQAKAILVKTGKGLSTLASHPELNEPVFENLYEASQYIIAQG